jgi:ABC-2 type transport system permease protein
MNIFMHELRLNIRSVVTWSISLTLLILLFMSLFSGFAVEAELLNQTLDKFPKEFLMAFGMDGIDLSTVLGFFSFAVVFCQLCVAIQGANYGFSLVSIEEREMTADFLLSKPVARAKIMTSKLLAALASLAITSLVVWISSYSFINFYRDGRPYDNKILVLLLLSITFLQLTFLSLGILISLLPRKIRSVTPYSMGMVFGMYVLNAFGDMLGEDKLSIITPFRHFDANNIIRNAGFDPLVIVSMIMIVLSIAGSYYLYTKRDIHTAV